MSATFLASTTGWSNVGGVLGARSLSDDDVWRMLAHQIAPGAEYNSPERQPFPMCLPGTRVKALDTLETVLTQTDRKVVWFFGGPGSGKSSIAYSIADRLRSQNRLAATFFFSRKHLNRSNTDRVFLTIGYQIGLLHHQAKSRIIRAIRHDPTLLESHKSRGDQLERLVAEPLRSL
ncbi:hypothetical protein CONPUDRAFT_59481, partial [Coniophora puteana RWD-64-598 SS2]